MSNLLIRSWAFQWKALGRSPRTMREYQRHLARFEAVLEADGRELLSATRQDAEAHLASIDSAAMRAYAWRALRSFFAFLAEEEEAPSIMVRVKCPKVPLTEVSTASESDYDKLMKACSPFRTATACRDAAIIAVFWACGLRRSELATLKLSDIDLDTCTLVVQRSKTGKSRRVPFDTKTAQVLTALAVAAGDLANRGRDRRSVARQEGPVDERRRAARGGAASQARWREHQ